MAPVCESDGMRSTSEYAPLPAYAAIAVASVVHWLAEYAVNHL